MGYMNRNNNRHYIIQISNGDNFAETCRNSLGGWQNMERRINERYNKTLGDTDRLRMTGGGTGTIAGHTVEVMEVMKL